MSSKRQSLPPSLPPYLPSFLSFFLPSFLPSTVDAASDGNMMCLISHFWAGYLLENSVTVIRTSLNYVTKNPYFRWIWFYAAYVNVSTLLCFFLLFQFNFLISLFIAVFSSPSWLPSSYIPFFLPTPFLVQITVISLMNRRMWFSTLYSVLGFVTDSKLLYRNLT